MPNRLGFVQTYPMQELYNKSLKDLSQSASDEKISNISDMAMEVEKEPNIIPIEPLSRINLRLKNYEMFANRAKRFTSAAFMNMPGGGFDKRNAIHDALADKKTLEFLGATIGGAVAGATGGPAGIGVGAAGGAIGYGISNLG